MEVGSVWAGSPARYISAAYDDISDSTKAIASGEKVQNPTAWLIIANQLRGEVAVSQQGVRNANDAISMVQTFDAAAGGISSNMGRMMQLAAQAETGTYSNEQKAIMQAEFQELGAEINRIAGSTQFNGNSLLAGEGTVIPVSIGQGPNIDIASGDLGLDVSGVDLTADAGGAVSLVQEHLRQISAYRGYLGGQSNRLEEAAAVIQVDIENSMAVESRISDTDIAMEVAALIGSRIIAEAAIAVQSQANVMHQTALQLLM